MACCGMLWQLGLDKVRFVEVSCEAVWLGSPGLLGFVMVRQVWLRQLRFVRFRHGTASLVTAVRVWFVRFRSVAVCSGVVRQLRFGLSWLGTVGLGMEWQLRQGWVWLGKVRQGTAVKARCGQVCYGMVRSVMVRHGKAVTAR